MTEYFCQACEYNTKNKSNYDKHLKTIKHAKKQQILKKNSRKTQEYHCKYCNKPFRHMQSMYHHIKYTVGTS